MEQAGPGKESEESSRSTYCHKIPFYLDGQQQRKLFETSKYFLLYPSRFMCCVELALLHITDINT